MNKVILQGNLAKDVELRATSGGSSVASLTVVTSYRYKDKDGNWTDKPEYNQCVAFGKTAENISKYFTKGSKILVEGRLQTRSWEKEGEKKYTTEVVVDQFHFCESMKKEAPKEEVQEEPELDDLPF